MLVLLIPVKVFVLIGLIKLLIQTEKVAVCAAVYAGVVSIFWLMTGHSFLPAMIAGTIVYAIAALYFFLLSRTQETTLFYVIAVVLGLVLVAA